MLAEYMPDISVIIVTWNSEKEIGACAASVINNAKTLSVELIIIDNNSCDNTFNITNKIRYSNIHTYKNASNLGFTKAVNQGISYSKGQNILLLNPDTILAEGCLEKLNNFLLDNPGYGACAPLMLNEDGSLQRSIRNFPDYWSMFCEFTMLSYIFPKTKLFGKWKMLYFDYSADADIQQPMAAVLMIRKSVLEKIQYMDERFEMFFNDVDLCKKMLDGGLKIRLLTEARVIHEHGTSIKKDKIRMIKVWNEDCSKYFGKHHPSPLLMLWLKINLKISEIFRILYHKIRK
jgi:GT2 family glycosyltransferase